MVQVHTSWIWPCRIGEGRVRYLAGTDVGLWLGLESKSGGCFTVDRKLPCQSKLPDRKVPRLQQNVLIACKFGLHGMSVPPSRITWRAREPQAKEPLWLALLCIVGAPLEGYPREMSCFYQLCAVILPGFNSLGSGDRRSKNLRHDSAHPFPNYGRLEHELSLGMMNVLSTTMLKF